MSAEEEQRHDVSPPQKAPRPPSLALKVYNAKDESILLVVIREVQSVISSRHNN